MKKFENIFQIIVILLLGYMLIIIYFGWQVFAGITENFTKTMYRYDELTINPGEVTILDKESGIIYGAYMGEGKGNFFAVDLVNGKVIKNDLIKK